MALSEENVSGWSLKLSVHWTKKGCSLWVSGPSKTSGSQTLVCIEDFFGVDKLWASTVIAAAKSDVSRLLSELTCKLID